VTGHIPYKQVEQVYFPRGKVTADNNETLGMNKPFCVRVEAFSTSQVQNVLEEGTIGIPLAKPRFTASNMTKNLRKVHRFPEAIYVLDFR